MEDESAFSKTTVPVGFLQAYFDAALVGRPSKVALALPDRIHHHCLTTGNNNRMLLNSRREKDALLEE